MMKIWTACQRQLSARHQSSKQGGVEIRDKPIWASTDHTRPVMRSVSSLEEIAILYVVES